MLASKGRMGSVRVIVPMNRCVHAAGAIDETEAEVDVERRNMRNQS